MSTIQTYYYLQFTWQKQMDKMMIKGDFLTTNEARKEFKGERARRRRKSQETQFKG